MASNQFCIIMAGGIGSRFWPLSREEKPKQFVDALGIGKTFIQLTYERFSHFIPDENFLVMTGTGYKALVLEQLPMLHPEQVLTEPCRRNTAPCIAYAMFKLLRRNPHAVAIVTPSDQYIGHETSFSQVMEESLSYVATHPVLMTVGIAPTYPATGYGYIQCKRECGQPFVPVLHFKEKPELPTAARYLSEGTYYWNSGMFIWSVQTIAQAFRQHLPEVGSLFEQIQTYDTPMEQTDVNKAFEASPSISIDYGIMEKASNVYVRCTDNLAWSDVGTWGALYGLLEKDEHENSISGSYVSLSDANHNLIKETNPNKRVIVDGLSNYIIADTEDILMICPLGNEERIKELVKKGAEISSPQDKK